MVVPELLLLKAPLHHVLRLFSWAFNIITSLRSFFSDHDDDLCPDQPTGGSLGEQEEEEEQDQEQFPKFQLLSSLLIQELLLLSTLYDHNNTDAADERDRCAVCLCEFEGGEQIRTLSNCRHVYHRGCLDGCIEHEHTTCPLCRASIFSGEEMEALMMVVHDVDGDGEGYYYLDRVLSAAGIPDAGDGGGGGGADHATESLVPFIFRH